MSINVDLEEIRTALAECRLRSPRSLIAVEAFLLHQLNRAAEEDENYWLWVEEQEKIHGSSTRAAWEASSPLAEVEEIPF